MRPLGLDPDAIADLVAKTFRQDGVGWSMGVQGALAEFAVRAGEQVAVRRRGRTVEAVTPGGGIRLAICEAAAAFVEGSGALVLAVPRSGLTAPRPGVTAAAGDPDALRPQDRGAVLVDLAVGHSAAAFCVRTADSALVARLRAVEGHAWREALAEIGDVLVAASPHRVVTGPLGRIEVYNPIPTNTDASPEGCHTHLLPALLATGREVAEGGELPPQLVAAGNCTNPGWGSELTLVKSPPT